MNIKDRSLFMAGVEAEEKVKCNRKNSLPHIFHFGLHPCYK
jgi:hypothetical protein